MRYIRYQYQKVTSYGVLLENTKDIDSPKHLVAPITGTIFSGYLVEEERIPAEQVQILPPLFPSKIVCYTSSDLDNTLKIQKTLHAGALTTDGQTINLKGPENIDFTNAYIMATGANSTDPKNIRLFGWLSILKLSDEVADHIAYTDGIINTSFANTETATDSYTAHNMDKAKSDISIISTKMKLHTGDIIFHIGLTPADSC